MAAVRPQVASLSKQLADAKTAVAGVQTELSVVTASRDDARSQLTELRRELQSSNEKALSAVHGQGSLEAKVHASSVSWTVGGVV